MAVLALSLGRIYFISVFFVLAGDGLWQLAPSPPALLSWRSWGGGSGQPSQERVSDLYCLPD